MSEAGWKTGLAVIGGALSLAFLTKKLVEDPILRARASSRPRNRRLALALSVTAAIGVSCVSAAGVIAVEHRAEVDRVAILAAMSSDCFGARSLAVDAECDGELEETAVFPSSPYDDVSPLFDAECSTGMTGTEIKQCVWGDPSSETRIALIGNSHAAVWMPAYAEIADRYGWRLDTYFKHSCTFNNASRTQSDDTWRTTCDEWVSDLTAFLAEEEAYEYVLTSAIAQNRAFRDPDTGAESFNAGVQGYESAWQPLIDRGATILAIRDYPRTTLELIGCGVKTPHTPCSRSVEEATVDFENEVLAVAADRVQGAEVVDMSNWFCADGACPVVIGNVHVYRDAGHFTETFGRSLSEPLLHELKEQAGFPDPQ